MTAFWLFIIAAILFLGFSTIETQLKALTAATVACPRP